MHYQVPESSHKSCETRASLQEGLVLWDGAGSDNCRVGLALPQELAEELRFAACRPSAADGPLGQQATAGRDSTWAMLLPVRLQLVACPMCCLCLLWLAG